MNDIINKLKDEQPNNGCCYCDDLNRYNILKLCAPCEIRHEAANKINNYRSSIGLAAELIAATGAIKGKHPRYIEFLLLHQARNEL